MRSRAEEWSARFRARVAAVAVAREASPEELHARELDASAVVACFCAGLAVLLTVAAVVSGVPWWAPAGVAGCAGSAAWAHRRARRRGGPGA